MPPATAERPVAFAVAMPLKALMMPTTVPNRPTKGAVEPMVARPLSMRFISAWTMATARSRPRLEASISSASVTWVEADWNSESPVATTLAMWLFLLRSAMEMASSSLLSLRAPATCCTNTRDCLRAALYMSARSIMMPTDQADMMKRINTTLRAGQPILCHMVIRSQPTSGSPWNIANSAYANIEFDPPPSPQIDLGSSILPVGNPLPSHPEPQAGPALLSHPA